MNFIQHLPIFVVVSSSTIFCTHLAHSEDAPQVIEIESNIIGDQEQPPVTNLLTWGSIRAADSLKWDPDYQPSADDLNKVDRNIMNRQVDFYMGKSLEGKAP